MLKSQFMKINLGLLFKNSEITTSKIEGNIGYFGLEKWWLSEFTEEERKHIEDTYHPFGLSPDSKPLTEGKITSTSMTAAGLLNCLAGWFNNPEYRHIARKMLKKAQEVNKVTSSLKNVLDEHFTLSEMIPVYYRDREKDDMLEKTIDACKQQIVLAPQAARSFLVEYPKQPLPSHRGYEQLVIIFNKQDDLVEAIQLCEQAKAEGWAGDWDNRIARYKKKLKKGLRV